MSFDIEMKKISKKEHHDLKRESHGDIFEHKLKYPTSTPNLTLNSPIIHKEVNYSLGGVMKVILCFRIKGCR